MDYRAVAYHCKYCGKVLTVPVADAESNRVVDVYECVCKDCIPKIEGYKKIVKSSDSFYKYITMLFDVIDKIRSCYEDVYNYYYEEICKIKPQFDVMDDLPRQIVKACTLINSNTPNKMIIEMISLLPTQFIKINNFFQENKFQWKNYREMYLSPCTVYGKILDIPHIDEAIDPNTVFAGDKSLAKSMYYIRYEEMYTWTLPVDALGEFDILEIIKNVCQDIFGDDEAEYREYKDGDSDEDMDGDMDD